MISVRYFCLKKDFLCDFLSLTKNKSNDKTCCIHLFMSLFIKHLLFLLENLVTSVFVTGRQFLVELVPHFSNSISKIYHLIDTHQIFSRINILMLHLIPSPCFLAELIIVVTKIMKCILPENS